MVVIGYQLCDPDNVRLPRAMYQGVRVYVPSTVESPVAFWIEQKSVSTVDTCSFVIIENEFALQPFIQRSLHRHLIHTVYRLAFPTVHVHI